MEMHIGKVFNMTISKSLRLGYMGDQTELPNISKYEAVVINVGMVTAAQVILRFWKSISASDFEK